MTDDLFTYELAHFLPFSREAYLRLFELHNTAVWPLGHLFAVAVAAGALRAAHRGDTRAAAALLAAAWAWVGWSFFATHYASLLWAAPYLGGAFAAQGVLLGVGAWRGWLVFGEPKARRARLGLAVFAAAVVGMPLTELLMGQSLAAVGWFGVAPDPTAVGTLGVLLIARTARWPLWLIPCAWGVVSALTWVALHG